jgi:hypothetical protein
LVLPPSGNRTEYIQVNPQFRAIFTSNPEEYCGVHATQDALLDRLVTINMPEPDELTQQEILVQKTEISRASALLIVRLVKAFRVRTGTDTASGLRSCLIMAKVCHEHDIVVAPESAEFREVCCDVLLSRSKLPFAEATTTLWELLNEFVGSQWQPSDESVEDSLPAPSSNLEVNESITPEVEPETTAELEAELAEVEAEPNPELETEPAEVELVSEAITPANATEVTISLDALMMIEPEVIEVAVSSELAFPEELTTPGLTYAEAEIVPSEASRVYEQKIYDYLQQTGGARLTQIEMDLKLDRFHTVDTLRVLTEKGMVAQHDRLFVIQEVES